MTKKQIWARKRNWLIMRLMGARSIFSHDNTVFTEDATQGDHDYVYRCKLAIDHLIAAMRESTYKEK